MLAKIKTFNGKDQLICIEEEHRTKTRLRLQDLSSTKEGKIISNVLACWEYPKLFYLGILIKQTFK